jgi:hypothetical protein
MKHLLPLYLLVLGLSACEQPIEYRLDDYDAKLVVNGHLQVDSLPVILLSLSRPYYGYVEQDLTLDFVDDAEVIIASPAGSDTLRLFTEERTIPRYQYGYFYAQSYDTTVLVSGYRGRRVIQPGTTYQLQVNHETHSLRAETTTPAQVDFEEVTYLPEYLGDTYLPKRLEMTVSPQADAAWYYRARIRYAYEGIQDYYDSDLGDFVYDTVRTEVNTTSQILPGEALGGNAKLTHYLNYYSYNQNGLQDTILVEVALETLNADMGSLLTSLQAQNISQGNPLVEPVLLYSNIEGGLGAFGAFVRGPVRTVMVISE